MKRSMSKEEFLALYQRQQSSGLTIKDFCDNESYPASCFHYWKKKYGLSHPYTKHTEPTGDSFIPLNINHTPAIPTSSCGDRRVTIELRKHSKKCTFYTLRFGCSFAAVNTIKPQLL